jgi:hypothetical protein
MKRSRTLWMILFGVPLLLVLPVVLIGSGTWNSGMIHVQVHEKSGHGTSFGAHVPAAIIPVALQFAPQEVWDELRAELGSEAPQALPIVRAALRDLSRCPDAVLVDVQSRDEMVSISKKHGAIEVYVDTPDEVIRVSVPLGSVGSVLSRIS